MIKIVTAGQIRAFANQRYLTPARASGKPEVTIRAGDVHNALGLKSRMPAVCGAIGANKFQHDDRLKLIQRKGPTQGANVFFTFQLLQ